LKRNVTSFVWQHSFERDEHDSEQDVFQLLFLNTENESIEAWETNSIECEDLINHLKAGESVFISPKRQNRRSNNRVDKEMKKKAYFTRI